MEEHRIASMYPLPADAWTYELTGSPTGSWSSPTRPRTVFRHFLDMVAAAGDGSWASWRRIHAHRADQEDRAGATIEIRTRRITH